MPRRYRVFAWIALVVLLNWLLLAVVPTVPTGGPVRSFALQVVGGTVFAQTAIAAAWTTFGPTPFMWRLPLSLLWLTMLTAIHAVNGWLNSGSPSESVTTGMLILCHWLLLQFPLWGIAIGFRVQLQHADEIESGENPTYRQFGIRQLMLVTAVVGVLLGIGRIAIPYLIEEFAFFPFVAGLIAFFVAADVLVTLPLVFTALLPRHTVFWVLSALALIGVFTACEMPLLSLLIPAVASSSLLGIAAYNVGTTIMLLALLTIVRFNGYSLARGPRASGKATA